MKFEDSQKLIFNLISQINKNNKINLHVTHKLTCDSEKGFGMLRNEIDKDMAYQVWKQKLNGQVQSTETTQRITAW